MSYLNEAVVVFKCPFNMSQNVISRNFKFMGNLSSNFDFFFPVALRPNPGYGLLIHEVSRSHTTHHSR